MTKKNITTEILALLAMACLGLAPGAVLASEVTGTLSADGTVVITSTDDDGTLEGNVSGEGDGGLGGTVVDDPDGSLGGTVVDDDNTLSGTVTADGGGGGGGGGGGSAGDDDDEEGIGGAGIDDGQVLGAGDVNLPVFNPLPGSVLGASSAPGFPNAGEQPHEGEQGNSLIGLLAGLAAASLLPLALLKRKQGATAR